ncbi:DsbA family oxidoreductase [Loktanella sp. DJP18]|uniref:DsbA family oxidoreductase n=1 Tax=Loktanella sp. DJP18 TaxID=3409788 RepID=UPI003BB71ABE
MTEPLRIDIVSDVVCPWCIVGYRQLEQALDATGIAYDLHWHPFELNPDMGPEGQNITVHIMEKYGSTRADSQANRDRLTALGGSLDFTFAFTDDSRMHNTFNAHQLIHWADTQWRGHDLKQALFTAHFTDGRNLSDPTVLVAVAVETGLDAEEALAVLADQRHAEQVRVEERFWQQQGITGVPAIIFDRKHLVTGAQGADNYARILGQLQEMKAGT